MLVESLVVEQLRVDFELIEALDVLALGRVFGRWNQAGSALTRALRSGMWALASACVGADMRRALIEYHTGTHIHSRRLSVLNGIQVCHRPNVRYAIALHEILQT